jgi:hypothetical protein
VPIRQNACRSRKWRGRTRGRKAAHAVERFGEPNLICGIGRCQVEERAAALFVFDPSGIKRGKRRANLTRRGNPFACRGGLGKTNQCAANLPNGETLKTSFVRFQRLI